MGVNYPIESLQNVDTKYGNCVVATVQDYANEKLKYWLYLPKRYAGVFTDEELRHIVPYTLDLIYRGKREQTTVVDILEWINGEFLFI